MEYLKIDETAVQWGISARRLQTLCAAGKIEGATRFGRAWMIPKDAKKPIDGRTKAGRGLQNATAGMDMPMPRKTPFLYMTNLYHSPGCGEQAVAALADNPEARHPIFIQSVSSYPRLTAKAPGAAGTAAALYSGIPLRQTLLHPGVPTKKLYKQRHPDAFFWLCPTYNVRSIREIFFDCSARSADNNARNLCNSAYP